MVTDLVLGANDEVIGVETYFGVAFRCKALILTTGTFLEDGFGLAPSLWPLGELVNLPQKD